MLPLQALWGGHRKASARDLGKLHDSRHSKALASASLTDLAVFDGANVRHSDMCPNTGRILGHLKPVGG
jgi:hypothetical protein